jgi:Uncharacterised nucleotidyltransferase
MYDALKTVPSVPAPVVTALAENAKPLRVRGLRQMSELVRVTALFQNAGIRVAEIKGMSLGILAYGTTSLKESVDLDLLVSPDGGADAVRLLLSNGYTHVVVGNQIRPDQIAALIRNRKDITLAGPGKIKLELHWRLSHGSGLLNGAGEALEWQTVEVAPRKTVATLAMPDLVSYLAVHGSLHGWTRLKWLADFDAIFRKATDSQRREWIEHAQALGSARCLQFAIAMSAHVIGPYDDSASNDTAKDFASNHQTRRVFSFGLRHMEAPYPAPRVTMTDKLVTVYQELSMKLPLFNRLFDAKSLVRHHLFTEGDILRYPLPNRLRYLYPVLRGVIWMGDRLPSASRKNRARIIDPA